MGGKSLLYEQYYDIYDEFAAKYSKVALLMQVGGFFEIYSPKDFSRGNAREITRLMNCDLVNKDPRNLDSPLMGGFPLHAIDKNLLKLSENDYTVIVVEQSNDPDVALEQMAADPSSSSGRAPRLITQIVSKGTMLSLDTSRVRNNVMSIFCTQYSNKSSKAFTSFGFAVTDLISSRRIIVHEIHSSPNDNGVAMDTAIRLIMQFEPVECIIVTRNGEEPNVVKHLGIKCQTIQRDVQTITHEETSFSDCINYAVGALKTFIYDHKWKLDDLDIVSYNSDRYLDLCATAIKQLDIPLFLSKNEINSTLTGMGNRLLWDRMVCPTLDVKELEDRYDQIDALTDDKVSSIRKVLKDLPDLDKWHQRLSLGKLSWSRIQTLHACYMRIIKMLQYSEQYTDLCAEITNLISSYTKVLKLDVTVSTNEHEDEDNADGGNDRIDTTETQSKKTASNITENIFTDNFCPNLDQLFESRKSAKDFVANFIAQACKVTPKVSDFKIKETLGIVTTNIRAENLKKHYKSWNVAKMQTTSIVYTDKLRDELAKLQEIDSKIINETKLAFETYQTTMYKENNRILNLISATIADIDFQQCSYFL